MRENICFLAICSLAEKGDVLGIALKQQELNLDLNSLRNPRGLSLLTWAVDKIDNIALDTLLVTGLDPNKMDGEGKLPLSVACGLQKLHMIQSLVEYKADVNKLDEHMKLSPLLIAFLTLHPSLVLFLFTNGARFSSNEKEISNLSSFIQDVCVDSDSYIEACGLPTKYVKETLLREPS